MDRWRHHRLRLPWETAVLRTLLVSDLHYDLRKLDWVLDQAADVDLVAIAGDVLDVASSVPLDAQITVVLEYLDRMAARATTALCSGNHDLDHRGEEGEKATAWIAEAERSGVVVDGRSVEVDGWLVTSCPWWEGPSTLRRMQDQLAEAAAARTGRWMWVYHGPPEGPLSWTGSRHFGDPELPGLLDLHRPDVVLCGHIHQAPHVDGGSWYEQRGHTWLFNSGHQLGPVPAHIRLDLAAGQAEWWSSGAEETTALDLRSDAQAS
jgi:Icc-related predicted phosphoesterase